MNARNSRTRSDVDEAMPSSDPLDALLAGVAHDRDDVAVAAFCADLRRQLGAQPVAAQPGTVRWARRPGRTGTRITSIKAWFATTVGALTFVFGGVAAAGALPGDLQHSVANVAHRIGLGFVPDSATGEPHPVHETDGPRPDRQSEPSPTTVVDRSKPSSSTVPESTASTTPGPAVPAGDGSGASTDNARSGEPHGDAGHDDQSDTPGPTPTSDEHRAGPPDDAIDPVDPTGPGDGADDHSADGHGSSGGSDGGNGSDQSDGSDHSDAPRASDGTGD